MSKRIEPFKESLKSICHGCFNISSDCFDASKFCETDNKIGKAYVKRCSHHNRDFIMAERSEYIVKVDQAADSRIEMMGGGYKEVSEDK